MTHTNHIPLIWTFADGEWTAPFQDSLYRIYRGYGVFRHHWIPEYPSCTSGEPMDSLPLVKDRCERDAYRRLIDTLAA